MSPHDPRPAVRDVTMRYNAAALCLIEVLQKAGRDLTMDSFQTSMESLKDWRDMFGGPPLTITPTSHHAATQSFLSVVQKTRWTPVVAEPLGY